MQLLTVLTIDKPPINSTTRHLINKHLLISFTYIDEDPRYLNYVCIHPKKLFMKRARLLLALIIFSTTSLVSFAGNGKDDEVKSGKVVSSFVMETMLVKEDGFLCWTTNGEHGALPYIIEQFIFDKWVAVGKIEGVGTPTPNSYSVPVSLNSGENKFRIHQQGYDKISRFSDAISYYSKKQPVTYKIEDKNQTLVFSSDTYFIVYNPYGAIIKQTYGNSLNISDYPKGYYCLIYDNKLGGFEKKKVIFKNSFYPIVISPVYVFNRKVKILG